MPAMPRPQKANKIARVVLKNSHVEEPPPKTQKKVDPRDTFQNDIRMMIKR